ncbi:hypothetical protein CS022_19695 [Veronia nyctiphanis]|uniref:Uncharacterized protein n=1 Tax=Veronia nyctiphanis TaxID=1278244 RepID=A0A4Q0YLX2_9GAMM|nr:hypothetical protein [Veronia nyctiphanis]RXJ71790.1 hypothetical protein CS022_19695 [Veronia nyctiphanis]
MPERIVAVKQTFLTAFDINTPWLRQIAEFCHASGDMNFGTSELKLAELLALSSPTLPSSFIDLANLIAETRQKNAFKHCDKTKRPKISGITRPNI